MEEEGLPPELEEVSIVGGRAGGNVLFLLLASGQYGTPHNRLQSNSG